MKRLRRDGQGGFATVELALTLLALVAVVLLCIGLIASLGTQLRVQEAARQAARALAAGENMSTATQIVAEVAGASAELTVGRSSSDVIVNVSAPLPLISDWGDFDAHSAATARLEEEF